MHITIQLTCDTDEESEVNDDAFTVVGPRGKENEEPEPDREEGWVTVKLPKKIISEDVCRNADRHGLSKRQTFAAVASVIKSSTGTVDDFVLSPSSVRRSRNEMRQQMANTLKESFGK